MLKPMIAVALVALGTVAAGDPVLLELDRSMTVALPAGLPESVASAFLFLAPTTGRFVVEARSLDVDTGLRVSQVSGEAEKLLAEDDDGGIGTDSRLVFEAIVGMRYAIVLQPVAEDWGGEVDLRIVAEPTAEPMPQGGEREKAAGSYWLRVEEKAHATGQNGREARALLGRAQLIRAREPERGLELMRRSFALERARLGEVPALARPLINLGDHLFSSGSLAEARTTFGQAVGFLDGKDGADTAELGRALHWLGATSRRLGDDDAAEPVLRRALAIREAHHGADSIEVGYTLSWLAESVWWLGRKDEAERLYGRTIAIYEQRLGSDHLETGWQHRSLGRLLVQQGKTDEGRAQLERALAILEARTGADAPGVADVLEDLGALYREIGQPARAIATWKRVAAIRERAPGTTDAAAKAQIRLGELAYAQGDHRGAAAHFERAVGILEAARSSGHSDLIPRLLSWRAAALVAAGAYEDARVAADRAVKLFEADPETDPTDMARAVNNLGMATGLGGELEEGIGLLARAIGMVESSDDAGLNLASVTRSNLVLLEQKRGGAEALARLLTEARVEAVAADAAADAERLLAVAALLDVLHAPEEALPVLRRAVDLKSPDGVPAQDAIEPLERLAILFFRLGRYDDARAEGLRALAAVRQHHGSEHAMMIHGLSRLAEFETLRGEYDAARLAIDEAVAIESRRLPPDYPTLADTLGARARLERAMGRADEAEAAARAALAYLEQAYGEDHPSVAFAFLRLSALLGEAGRYAEAEEVCNRALSILEERRTPGDVFTAIAGRVVLARILLETGRPKEGLESVLRLLDEADRALGQADPTVHRALGSIRKDLAANAPDGSIGVFAKIVLNRSLPGMGSPDQVTDACAVIGEILRLLGRPRDAIAFLNVGLEVAEESGDDGPDLIRNLFVRAAAAWDTGAEDSARQDAARAARILDRRLREWISVLPDGQALAIARAKERPEDLLLTGLVAGRSRKEAWLRECWDAVLRRRGLILEELSRRHRSVLADESPEATAAFQRLATARRRLASLSLMIDAASDVGSARNGVARARHERDEAEADLARRSASYRSRRAVDDATLDTVAGALPQGAALVEFVKFVFRGSRSKEETFRYVALILPGGEEAPAWVDLGEASVIDTAVRGWSDALSHAWRDRGAPAAQLRITEKGERLRKAIWDPVVAKLGVRDTVFVVLDGSLHRVPIDALPSGSGYVAEAGPRIHVLSTGRDLVRLNRNERDARRSSTLLAVGDPDYDAGTTPADGIAAAYRGETSTCIAPGRVRWDRLPASGTEVAAVAALVPVAERRVLERESATEDRVKALASGSRVVHLATHAFFLDEDCAGALLGGRGIGGLSVAKPPAAAPVTRVAENPLLRAGLVLAGANHRGEEVGDGEDGILTAEEIASLDLGGADLVTLSACDTGRGDIERGEGVLGLRRAFEVAGARSLVMSLWPVPDAAARDWMVGFYRAWVEGTGVLEAARRTRLEQLSLLRERGQPTHPYAWAGFVTVGEWR